MQEQFSFLENHWKASCVVEDEEDFVKRLFAEKIGTQDPKVFLNPKWEDLHSPWDLLGMKKAVMRIHQAIEKKERIMVFGDFDADGITATVILAHGLKRIGANVSYCVPDRVKDSHGLKTYLVDDIESRGANLLITVDCGINDHQVIDYAQEKGIDVIVTDHHQVKNNTMVSNAVAVINPHQVSCTYPEKNLSGAAVAFKLLQALSEDITDQHVFLQPYLELCAIGLVADCMPLSGEVRILTKLGIEALQDSSWPALQVLFERLEIEEVSAEVIGFQIAPRLNVASRLGNVLHALQLFLGDRASIPEQLDYLEDLNQKRKILTQEGTDQAYLQIQKEAGVQVLYHENWEIGILGLIASKISEKTHCPAIAITNNGEHLHASCRAPKEYDMMEILTPQASLLKRFGGHKGAAGFSMEGANLPAFKKALQTEKIIIKKPTMGYFSTVETSWIDLDLLSEQSALEPFGIGNSQPVYQLKNLIYEDIKFLGKEKNHLRIEFLTRGRNVWYSGFFMADIASKIMKDQSYDCLILASKNVWNQQTKVQFKLVDMRPSVID